MPVFLFLQLALALVASASAATTDAQANALLAFKAAMREDPGGVLSSWQASAGVCTWQGVSCMRGQVVGITLVHAGLRGSLPPELAGLQSLQQIHLAGNRLAGTLPESWRVLASLERLNLEGNNLSGSLPATWSALTSLRSLNLAGNQLEGSLPVEWGALGQLLQLNLGRNNLSGDLPTSWSQLGMLTQLRLGRNQLNGTLPRQWGRLRVLLQLDLSANQLGGTLPPAWQGMAQLTSLDLSQNQLVGQLPRPWGQLPSMQVLSLRGNLLTGSLPSTWNKLAARMYRVDLSGNAGLCGGMLDSLARACGAAQRQGTNLTRACVWQSDAEALLDFKASVTSDPSSVLASWQDESNPCGLPGWQGATCTDGRVTGIDLAGSKLEGVPLEVLARLPKLRSIQLSGNTAAGSELPGSWGLLAGLKSVSLSHCSLAGQLPQAWGALRALEELSLQGNALTAELPAGWSTMQSLRFLNLAHNSLNGSLPATWSSLASLQEAELPYNQLQGPIPSPWTELLSLTLLDLEGNTAICGGQPHWHAGAEVRVGSTNIQQSCLAAYASGTVVGVIVGVTVGGAAAAALAIIGLLVYVRRQRGRLALLQRERSLATFSSRQLEDKLLVLRELEESSRAGSRGKLLQVHLPEALEQLPGQYIKVPSQTPYPGSSPERPGYAGHEHTSPTATSGMPSPERQAWQVAAYAAEHGVDLVPRRHQRRLFRSKSEAVQQSAADLV